MNWHVSPEVVRSVVGIILMILGAVTLIALLLPGQGRLTDLWRDSIAPWFGAGRWLLPFVLLGAGIYIERARRGSGAWTTRVAGGTLMYLALLGLIELFDPGRGGRIGDFLATLLGGLITAPGAFVLLIGAAIVGLLIMLDAGLPQLLAPLRGAARTVSAALVSPDRATSEPGETNRTGRAAARAVGPGRGAADEAADVTSDRRRRGRAEPDGEDARDIRPGIPAAIPSGAPMSSTFAAAVPVAAEAPTGDRGPFAAGAAWLAGGDGPAGRNGNGTGAVPAVAGRYDGPDEEISDEPAPRPEYQWVTPPLTLLDDIAAKKGGATMDHERNAAIITAKLASFNIPVRVEHWNAGPVVTQYEVEPAPEVKVSRIEGLADDLAMALAARTLRIEAPIPGKSVVGLEIPNSDFNIVSIRRIAEEADFRASPSKLTFALGRDVAGHARSVDLAKMPHLLIAGATGSGKSVMVNALIASLLLSAMPDEVHLILMDLKRVELAAYNGVPHLKVPVITEPGQAKAALKWAVAEMEYRYRRLAGATARNIGSFNETRVDPADRMPYIVIMIDELADLMMREGKNVEDPIVRLAQKARATGIHMVLATQRPSVNVVTGLIKANFPSRIAFAMASQIDSRTILDTPGAEDLIGRGDMLYQPADLPRPIRLQGVFVADREIHALADHWKKEAENAGGPRYDMAIVENDEDSVGSVEEQPDEEADRLLMDAVRVVQEYDRASASLLQRRLKVGYARAARIIDQLESRGYVGAFDGSNARQVLRRDPTPAVSASRRNPDGDVDDG
ncbi:MAG: DNA translocase FtsK [Chloroflexi bacterium]|nr:DNA translocase FtsK [Chloroflexota bacterium]